MTPLSILSFASISPLAYYGDPTVQSYGMGGTALYWVILIGTMILSGIAAARVRSTYAHYSQVPASSGLTGAELAQRILQSNGIHDVTIHATQGELTDHYDPA